uniref:G patch domain containing 1 n=1 Tax=Oryzias latipes TaxID=8090 RepID=H2MWV6_ORYLA
MASDGGGEEDFVTYGTPLEPLEEDEPLKKPVPLHEQTVKDEKGRYQRFHGAFTGGFSAGYFNTVGSKEGWAPSTFVSSRQQKAEKPHARPEDFMDEEDFGEHGIAPRQITTSREFSSGRRDEAADKARAVGAQASLIPGDLLLEELITPARSSIGVELLRRMGWREGQGVGPRVKRKARKQQADDGARVYGCALPPAGSEEDEEEEEEFAPENVTYAPKDVTPMDFTPKSGLQGLGYRGLDPGLALQGSGAAQHIELFDPQGGRLFGDSQRGSRRRGVAGQAFGVGALEDDDEDIYHRDSMSRYDTVLGGEEPGDGLYGWTAPQQYSDKKDRSRDASYLGKILEGFTLAQNPLEEKQVFPPPTLPRGYRPVHHFRPKVDVLRLSGVSPALAEALKTSKGHMVKEEPQQGGRHQLVSGQRGALLGEDTLQGPRSVMDLLKPEDKERLLRLRSSTQPASSPAPPTQTPPTTSPVPSALTPLWTPSSVQQEAQAAWRGTQPSSQTFRPFDKNPSKQARYDLYLSRLRQGDRDAVEQSLDPCMTEWERSRERDEFVRASILYRPASTSLSSRFTRGKNQEDEDTVEVARDQEGDVDDKQAAVKMKMFGKMTRETFEWHPDKLLCKRFNVPDPYTGSGLVGLPKVKRDKFSVFNFLAVTESREPKAPPKPPDTEKKSRWDVSQSKEAAEKKDDLSDLLSTGKNHAETGPEPEPSDTAAATSSRSEEPTDQEGSEKGDEEESRPPMDLFKAIFASSSEEKSSSSEAESNDEEEAEERQEEEVKVESEPLNLFSISTGVSSSAATPACQPPVPSQTKEDEEEEVFGPKLPPPSAVVYTGGTAGVCPPSQEDKRVRKRSKEKKPKKSKHKKEKKVRWKEKQQDRNRFETDLGSAQKKKQKKKKGKQKKSRKESESSSDDSDPDVSPDLLLKRLKNIRSQQSR